MEHLEKKVYDLTPFTDDDIQKAQLAQKLRVPQKVVFPTFVDRFFYSGKKSDDIEAKEDDLERYYNAFLDAIAAMPTTENERQERKQKLIDYLQPILESYKKELEDVEMQKDEAGENWYKQQKIEIELAIKTKKAQIYAWDDYPLDMVDICKRKSINRLEVLISETDPERQQLKNLYRRYIAMIEKSLLKPILKAGDFDNKKVFDNLLNAGLIDGDVDSWKSYFVGTEYSKRKPIVCKMKKSELLYFISKYCPDFKTGTRKIKELNEIFNFGIDDKMKTTDEICTSQTKKNDIDKLLK